MPDSGHSDFNVLPAVSYIGNNNNISDSGLGSHAEMTFDDFPPPNDDDMQSCSSFNHFPAFFEQVMLPGLEAENGPQGTQQPRLFDFMQDNDFTFAGNDIFGTDFIPDLDKILDSAGPLPNLDNSHPSPDDQESASRRAAAFQRSIW